MSDSKRLMAIVDGLMDELIDFRVDLHRNPELSWQEYRTTDKIKEKLAAHGISDFKQVLETGGYVDFVFDESRPFIMMRADIDALPIQDKKNTHYRSQNNGVCHACGHDAHTATVLGTALAVKKAALKPNYNLRFVFQPAEELLPSGAPKMIEKGALENVALVLGMHKEPRLRLGTLGLADGWINMQSNRLELTLKGRGGHSARPAEAPDLLWIASRIIQDSYEMIYRKIDLRDSSVVLTFTEINAGEGYNIIPTNLTMTGTLRISDPKKDAQFMALFEPYLKHLEAENDCTIELTKLNGAPAVFNNPDLIEKLTQNLAKDFWLPTEIDTVFRTPGGDDFSYYTEQVPGAMVRIGVRTENMTASLHDGDFDVHPDAIRNAVSFFLHQICHL